MRRLFSLFLTALLLLATGVAACAEGYAYGWWLKNLIETATPLLKGFTIRW